MLCQSLQASSAEPELGTAQPQLVLHLNKQTAVLTFLSTETKNVSKCQSELFVQKYLTCQLGFITIKQNSGTHLSKFISVSIGVQYSVLILLIYLFNI